MQIMSLLGLWNVVQRQGGALQGVFHVKGSLSGPLTIQRTRQQPPGLMPMIARQAGQECTTSWKDAGQQSGCGTNTNKAKCVRALALQAGSMGKRNGQAEKH